MDLGLTDRVFLVTGGGRGLGRATAQVLVDEGARVVVSGRSEAALDEALIDLGENAVSVVADNADPETPARLLHAARERWGRVDGALISVGGPPTGRVIDVDRRAVVGGVRLGVPRRACGCAARSPRPWSAGGSLALVLSSSVRTPIAGLAVSNGLRPGLAMAAKALADELGPRRDPGQRPAAGPGRHRPGRRARRGDR